MSARGAAPLLAPDRRRRPRRAHRGGVAARARGDRRHGAGRGQAGAGAARARSSGRSRGGERRPRSSSPSLFRPLASPPASAAARRVRRWRRSGGCPPPPTGMSADRGGECRRGQLEHPARRAWTGRACATSPSCGCTGATRPRASPPSPPWSRRARSSAGTRSPPSSSARPAPRWWQGNAVRWIDRRGLVFGRRYVYVATLIDSQGRCSAPSERLAVHYLAAPRPPRGVGATRARARRGSQWRPPAR